MNARERLERIERELRAVRERILDRPTYDAVCEAEHAVATAVLVNGAELDRVEVPGE